MAVLDPASTSNVGARKYRSRKNRPCDVCRKRKSACIRQAGVQCVSCANRGLTCTYELQPLKRHKSTEDAQQITKTVNGLGKENTAAAPASRVDSRLEVGFFLLPNDNPVKSKQATESKTSSPQSVSVVDSNGVHVPLEQHNDQTSMFIGFSGHFDPWLLQKLNVGDSFRNPSKSYPLYFTSCPTDYLDSIPDKYNTEKINSVVDPHQKNLIRLYFENIDASFPIINKSFFRNEKTSSCLLATLYMKSFQYIKNEGSEGKIPKPVYLLLDYTLRLIPLEFSSATLQTIQATLLYIQTYPIIVRDAHAPHDATLTASLVGACQQLGLHIDPADWDIPVWEKRLRRRLWWFIFVQDKWMSLGFSRPSHIHHDEFNVGPILQEDFIDEDDPLFSFENYSPLYRQGVQLNISMINLTTILSCVLTNFFSMKSLIKNPLKPREVYSMSMEFISQVEEVERNCFPQTRIFPSLKGSWISLNVAKTTLLLTIYKHLMNTDEQLYSTIEPLAYNAVVGLIEILTDIGIGHISSNWWACTKDNFGIVGVTILTFYEWSIDTGVHAKWTFQAHKFRECLKNICKFSMIPKLGLIRFEKLINVIERRLSDISYGHSKNHPKDTPDLPSFDNSISPPTLLPSNDMSSLNLIMEGSHDYVMQDDFIFDWLKNNEFQF